MPNSRREIFRQLESIKTIDGLILWFWDVRDTNEQLEDLDRLVANADTSKDGADGERACLDYAAREAVEAQFLEDMDLAVHVACKTKEEEVTHELDHVNFLLDNGWTLEYVKNYMKECV